MATVDHGYYSGLTSPLRFFTMKVVMPVMFFLLRLLLSDVESNGKVFSFFIVRVYKEMSRDSYSKETKIRKTLSTQHVQHVVLCRTTTTVNVLWRT